tara:strand:- start:45 stop:245 length:201 start_codon:yes stop_codon:yes gene_type:complete
MNLILRPLDDPNGVTWSIIWMMVILLVGVVWTILYIFSYDEKFPNDDTTKQEELLQLPSDKDQPSS